MPARSISGSEQQTLFEYCLTGATNEHFQGWDFPWDLAYLSAGMVTTTEQRKQLYETLDRMASPREKADPDGWISQFHRERAAEIKLTVIERLDDEKAHLAFLEEHVMLPQFRERLARFHLEHANLSEARRLCEEWLNDNKTHHRTYGGTFLAILLDIAQIEKKPDEIARLAEGMFLATGDFKFYELLKKTVGGDGWPALRDRMIQTVSADHRGSYFVADILVREELWDQLLAWVKKQPYEIEKNRKHLEPRFPAEMCALYERSALRVVEAKANRDGYQEACRYLRRMQKLGQKKRVEEIVADLREKYPRRRALLEELAAL